MLLTLALLGQADAADFFVDSDTSLNSRIDAAPDSGTPADYRIWVLPGDYALDKRDIVHKDLEIRALIPGTVLFRRNNDNKIYDVKGNANVLFHGIDFDGENERVFVTSGGNGANLTIERAHFEDGTGDGGGRGGYITHDTSGTLRLTNVYFGAASATEDGGHVRVADGSVEVTDSIFFDGSASDDGGCLSVTGGATAVLTRTQFLQCDAGDLGGGLYHNSSGTATLGNTWFEQNNSADWGGSIWAAGPLSVDDSMICRGTSEDTGTGGMYWDGVNGADLLIDDSIFLNNGSVVGTFGGAALRARGGNASSAVAIDHSTFVGNTAFGNHVLHLDLTSASAPTSVTLSHFAYQPASGDVARDYTAASATFSNNNLWSNTSIRGWTAGAGTNTAVNPGYADPGGTTCDPNDLRPTPGTAPLGQPGAFTVDGFVDADGDGYYPPIDCDDTPGTGALINPGMPTDLCDGIDNDCDLEIDEDFVPGATAFWLDADGDGFGDPNVGLPEACRESAFVVSNDSDCDDGAGAAPTTLYYLDTDGDGYVDESTEVASCEDPGGDYVLNAMGAFDCDDNAVAVNPGAAELCDGIDNNCVDGIDEASAPGITYADYWVDDDGDGYGDENDTPTSSCSVVAGSATNGTDCDDSGTGAEVNPAADEICDGIDNNCADGIDEASAAMIDYLDYWADDDDDGFGDQGATPTSSCSVVADAVTNNEDCDDAVFAINPDAEEVCDGLDNNCVDGVDEASAITFLDYYIDDDGDGYGDENATPVNSCSLITGSVANNEDCDDSASGFAINPGAVEVCDGDDNNCDGDIDEASAPMIEYVDYYTDADGDGFGDENDLTPTPACAPVAGEIDNTLDCDDTPGSGFAIKPGAAEVCDGLDNDCDGISDNANSTDLTYTTYYEDRDGDQFGADSVTSLTCNGSVPAGYVVTAGDCQDRGADAAERFPGNPETCDGIDNDCDAVVDQASAPGITYTTYYRDLDGDTFGDDAFQQATCDGSAPPDHVANNLDCADVGGNASIRFPTNAETCDGVDNDCDLMVDEADSPDITYTTYFRDLDGDQRGDPGFPEASCDGSSSPNYVPNSDDCDDLGPDSEFRWTDNSENCDGIDNDCNGLIDDTIVFQDWYRDLDGDGAGDPNVVQANLCEQPTTGTWVTDSRDCDDTGPDALRRSPFLAESCDSIDNDCDQVVDNGLQFTTFFLDADMDNFGDPAMPLSTCMTRPAGYLVDSSDCDDSTAAIAPGLEEICNGVDEDCNTLIDDGLDFLDYYPDEDLDTYGDRTVTPRTLCMDPQDGSVTNGDDCQDQELAGLPTTADRINPGAVEVCDGIDNNCDGVLDGADPLALVGQWWPDTDNDGFGDINHNATLACAPVGLVPNNYDCNDQSDEVYPFAPDGNCDGIDNNCDEQIDEEAVEVPIYIDDDEDGFTALDSNNEPAYRLEVCPPFGSQVTPSEQPDCDDTNVAINPDAVDDNCDGIDDDCDGQLDEDAPLVPTWIDADGDGFFVEGPPERCPSNQPPPPPAEQLDCDDNQGDTYPGSTMLLCDGGDGDCDGVPDQLPAEACGNGSVLVPPAPTGCNCDNGAGPATAPVWLLGLAGLLGLRRRRA